MNATLRQRLLLSRRDLNLNQEELEQRSGVSQATISRIERNQTDRVKLETIEALAKALGVRPEYLAGWSDDALGEDRPANVAEGHLVYDAATPDERRRVQAGNGYDMTFNGSFALQDAYGNVEESVVIRAQLKRATLERINWDNLVAVELSQVADYYWEHMAFRE